jgi:predicted MFS family arabinose efflux permease
LFLTTTSILLIISQTAFTSYLVLFLTESLTKTVTLAGFCLTVAHLGGACGRIGWGYVSDRWMGGDRSIVLGTIALISAGAIFALDLLPAQAPPWILVLIVLLFGVSGLGWAGLHLTSNAEKVDGRLVGTATSVSISFVLLGVITGPLIFGYLVDLTRSYSFAWQAMALIAIVAIVPLLFIAPRDRLVRLPIGNNKD